MLPRTALKELNGSALAPSLPPCGAAQVPDLTRARARPCALHTLTCALLRCSEPRALCLQELPL